MSETFKCYKCGNPITQCICKCSECGGLSIECNCAEKHLDRSPLTEDDVKATKRVLIESGIITEDGKKIEKP